MATDDLLVQLERARSAALESVASPATPDCPDASVWAQLLDGGRRSADANVLLRHALGCPHCGSLLRQSAEAAATSEPTAAERELLSALPSSGLTGQHRLAQRLGRGAPRPGAWRWRAAWGTLAVVVVIFLVVWVPGAGRADLAIWLLNRAYAQQRTLPLRFAGAGYGALQSPRRGPAEPPSADLLEAEGLLEAALARRPNDAHLLQAQAHADLLRSDADGAIRSLTRALALQPALPNLHTDLGSAYYLRAAGGHDADYGTALNQLGQAIARNPNDAIARFNRALVEEALNDWTGAVDDWSAYLKLDPSGPWAGEARRHLNADRQRVASHDAAAYAPLLPPASVSVADLSYRSEAYLHAATVQWLPAAYPVAGAPSPAARHALLLLARVLRQQHHDGWVTEMLAQRPSPAYARALSLLSSAIAENQKGAADVALAQAHQAARLFAASGSAAGARRAAFAEVYALHTAERGQECMAVLEHELAPAATRGEPWIAGEAALERYDCSGMAGHPDTGAIARALRMARRARLPGLLMRILAFAYAASPVPDSDASWRGGSHQLALYWREPVDAYRAYQLEMLFAYDSAQRQQWFAAERLAHDALGRLQLTHDISYLAMARQQFADFAQQCGFPAEALRQRQIAAGLFNQLPATPATDSERSYNDIDLATLDMASGNATEALAELARFRRDQPPVGSLEDRALPYFTLRGQWDLQQGRIVQAEAELRAAILIQEADGSEFTQDQDRLGWQQRSHDAYRAWVEAEWRVRHDPVRALEYWEWARAATIRPAHPLPPAFLAAASRLDATSAPVLPEPRLVRSQLASLRSAQVISYDLQPQDLLIWIFDNRGVHGVREPIASAQLEAAAHQFAAACADPASDPALLDMDSRQLYAWLLAPVAAWLDPARVLVIEPDGMLAAVPFAALRAPHGRYLPQPVVQSPGLGFAALAHPAGAVTSAARMLAVANPAAVVDAAGAPLPPLPATAVAAARAVARFGPGSRVLAGAAATRARVLAALPRAVLVHFAGHALPGRLLLARGDFLTAADFTPQRMASCGLAIFAACSTAADGLFDPADLVRASLKAGVPQVIASRWAVDSAATGAFFRVFYARLCAGASAPRALLAAQQALRHQPATSAPFYWAAFAVFGART